jgi:hypothetical protein
MSPYPEGTLVKEEERPDVYRITDGRKLRIPSAYSFEALGYKWRDVVIVPAGALDGIPTDSWPSHSPTPGSVVWVPDAPDLIGRAVWHPLPLHGSREWRVWGRTVRTRELRGWLSYVAKGCNSEDPDWHWQLVLDLGWARTQGIDVNAALWAGNLLTNGVDDPGSTVRAKCGLPQVEIEISGWPIKELPATTFEPATIIPERGTPPDWQHFDIRLEDGQRVECVCNFKDREGNNLPGNGVVAKWPFNPLAPNGRRLKPGQYVSVYGGIVTDHAHFYTDPSKDSFNPEHVEMERLWRTGAEPKRRDDGRDISRYTEVHPPDRIDIVDNPPWRETIRMVAVAAPGTWLWRRAPQSTLNVTIPAPPRPPVEVELQVEEFVAPETDRDMIVQGNASRTGARITTTEEGVHLFLTVAGRRSLSWPLTPGRFRALYRVYWLGTWSEWNSLGGAMIGSPAVGQNADGRLEVFVQGTNTDLCHRWQESPGGGWSGWNSLGGAMIGNPAVARNHDGRLEVFVQGTDTALWHKWQESPGGGWSGWNPLGGAMIGSPAVGRNHDGRLEVFVQGTNTDLCHRWQVRRR